MEHNTVQLISAREAAKLLKTSHPRIARLVKKQVIEVAAYEGSRPLFDRAYIEALADSRKQAVA